jgi:serine-type D-Ala-D-Ala carboxypeptidase/endopeptidase (penicillin-binding protein 4)
MKTSTRLAALLALCSLVALPVAQARLPAPMLEALAKAQIPPEAVAVVVMPADARTRALPAIAHRATEPMQPASTMKALTAAAALDLLGPNHRDRTDLLSTAPAQGGVLAGPLYLRGGADPDLDWASLWQVLGALRDQGIHTLGAGVVVDRTLFRPSRADLGAPPFDESPEWAYNTIPDALQLNAGVLSFYFAADRQALQSRTRPLLPEVQVDSSAVQLIDAPCADWEDHWQPPLVNASGATATVSLRGAFPLDCSAQADLELLDRQWVTDRMLRQLWTQLGGQLQGEVREGATPAGATVLASHQGRPLAEVLRGMVKRSDNPLARLAFLRLGVPLAQADPTLTTQQAGAQAVQAWMRSQRIDTTGVMLDNGSGLSRSERLSAHQLGLILRAAHAGPWAPEFIASLPIAGVDGTMRNRLKTSPAAGRARLKTGTLSNASALAGYVPDRSGRLWVVVAIVNHANAGQARPALDALIDWAARTRITLPPVRRREP